MRKFLMSVCLSAGAGLMMAGAAAADPVEGVWQTQPDDGFFAHVEMVPCGAAICGTIVRAYDASGTEYASPNVGRQIVIDMVPQGGGEYSGQVWRPSNDRVYIGNMTLNGNALRLRGCVLGGVICSGQDWVRVQ